MVAITPTTELAAVNLILRNMGETPINTLSGDIPLEASLARNALLESSEHIQKRGWFFNTEYYRLSPDNRSQITLPLNTLHVECTGDSSGIPVTVRDGNKLYNMTPYHHGLTWDHPVNLMIILGLDFEELPVSARLYIAYRTARLTQAIEVGDALTLNMNVQDETLALANLEAEQLVAEPLSLLDSPDVLAPLAKTVYGTGFIRS